MITVTRISKGKGSFYQVDLSEGDALRVSGRYFSSLSLIEGSRVD